ncbi:MAG TPA: hypothetical protein VMT60_00305 [Candidatus Bathyarchaeia archaeon]|nr:hypothetical protein [Candidatus Bathyarchaeia archaeon]
MKLPLFKGIIFAALFASVVPLLIAVPPLVQVVAGILLAYVLPGFVFLVFIGERERPDLDDIFLPIVISPIILTLVVLAFHAAGSSLSGAVHGACFALLALLAIGLIKEARGSVGGAPRPTRSIIVTCALFAGAVLTCYAVNRSLLMRSDAWYHASVLSEIVDRGIPPHEPYLPDFPIHYMWIYHLFVASSKQLTGLGVFPALGLFNVMAAVAFPYLVFRLVTFFSTRRRDLIAAPIFAISGLASAAWILWPLGLLRAAVGEHRGWHDLMRLFGQIDINSWRVIGFLSPFDCIGPVSNFMVSIIDKFITVTAFGFALDLFLLCFVIALSVGFERRFALKAFLASFLLILGTLLFHVVVGMALMLSIVGSGMLLVLYRVLRRGTKLPVFHALTLPAAAMLAAVCGFPYVLSLMKGGQTGGIGSYVHLGYASAITIALPLGIIFRPARKALVGIFRGRTQELVILATWTIALLVCNLFIELAARNESKLIFPLFLILFPLIVFKILDWIEEARGRKRALLVAWMSLLFLVPPVLTFRGFILDRPTNPCEVKRYYVTPDELRIFDWIQANTSGASTVIGSSTCDLMPVLAHRRDIYPDLGLADVFQYTSDKIKRFSAIRDTIYSGTELKPEDLSFLRSVGCPFYIVVWTEDIERVPRERAGLDAHPEVFEPVFQNAGGTVYFIRGT